MPWTYSQSTGRLSRGGEIIGRGYSGAGSGKNNPGKQGVLFVGPIPRGRYSIGTAHRHPLKGPVVMNLTPSGHSALGRTEFLIHGDNHDMNGTASQGCIILSLRLRELISLSGDRTLEVVE